MTQSHRISHATSDQQRGITVDLLNRGATIAGIRVHGVGNLPEIDTVLRYASDSDYDTDRFYLGSTVGPVANRLDGGRFDLPARAIFSWHSTNQTDKTCFMAAT